MPSVLTNQKVLMKFILILFLCLYSIGGYSQTANQFNSWWTYSGNHKISDKNSLHTLYSFRRHGPISDWQQSLLRIGYNLKVTDNLTFTPGYDWVVTFPYGEQPVSQRTTEHRITAQFIVKNKLATILLNHRYRFEQRFIGNTNTLSKQRLRYRITLDIPLHGKTISEQSFFMTFFNEVFINFGNEVANHIFDQNWIYSGLGYKINSSSIVKIGYMNQYLVKPGNELRENNHTFQASISKNFNFIKKTK